MPDIQKLNVGGTDFDIDDPNDVEQEGGELADTVINYDSATTPTIGSFTAFLNQFVSGTKVGQWFKNFRAGCDFLLHIGSIVNNCVSDNEALPLSAAQGKVLMDEITQLKSDLTEYIDGTVLYDGEATQEAFTLYDNVANYKYIEVQVKESSQYSFPHAFRFYVSPSGYAQYCDMTVIYESATSNCYTFRNMVFTFTGTSASRERIGSIAIYHDGTISEVTTTNMYIYKVIGYK